MMLRLLYALLLCSAFLSEPAVYAAGSDAGSGKGFIWKIQYNTATSYLLGSIHAMKKESYPLNSKIETAFDKSEVLVVEADINNMGQNGLAALMTEAFYSDSDSLDKHVSKATFDAVMNEADRLGMERSFFMVQKPWFIAISLEAFLFWKMGFDPNYGVDKHFLDEAANKKQVLELENIDEQLALLSGLSDDEQDAFLNCTVKSAKNEEKMPDMLLASWNTGDAKRLESIMSADSESCPLPSSITDRLITKRNITMELKIESMLKTGKSYFIVVGAGHLVGGDGIIELLEKKGYAVEQLQ